MSTHNGTDGSAAPALCPCGLANGERRNGSSPAHHAVVPAAEAPLPAPPSPAAAEVAVADASAAAGLADRTRTTATRRFRMEVGDTVIQIEWDSPGAPAPPNHAGHASDPAPRGTATAAAPAPGTAPEPRETAARYVRAPLVGTFYHAPEVGARPFVGVGDIVQPGQTVGIIEVMKMMNPVTADVAGRVTDMIVGDAQPVEFDQPLIALEARGGG
ncbi:acetyl-CoA carboxylase biotin carboxyl carrier protein subunit [Yinghuangia sp. ASG 101]|uniref:acetyl-CoA carboxylase biotin carboxyl carrier protein n=1 Tax=Yinghuangia sp. ASG 101 TaxID=2896848 RepID=UPI001E4B73F7|nr:biotin/lipoyl-containing protein [Yinghuangia sp. ASG 101]UGQ10798.1 acetyl-CoA carboxylase biotin carboxyl carrier protein subunit [Yinghuangia sp. ASG 101]